MKAKVALREIDLSKGKESDHPDISLRKTYLALIDGEYFTGKFSRQWYGWNFDGWNYNPAGLQFDAPGSNCSRWERLWEIDAGGEK